MYSILDNFVLMNDQLILQNMIMAILAAKISSTYYSPGKSHAESCHLGSNESMPEIERMSFSNISRDFMNVFRVSTKYNRETTKKNIAT